MSKWDSEAGNPCQVWVGEIGINEESLLSRMLYMAVLDAQAIAVGDVSAFPELMKNHQKGPKGAARVYVLEKASRQLRAWLWGDQFSWYVRLLGWEPGVVRERILTILQGKGKQKEVGLYLKSEGARSRWERVNPNVALMGTERDMCKVRAAGFS